MDLSKYGLYSVNKQDWSLHRKGPIDQQRHKEKIKEAVKKSLSDIVSEENIILSDGKKTIKVPSRSLYEYRFRYDSGQRPGGGQGEGKCKVGVVFCPGSRGRGKG